MRMEDCIQFKVYWHLYLWLFVIVTGSSLQDPLGYPLFNIPFRDLLKYPLLFYRTPSSIVKRKPSYNTRMPRSRSSRTLSPEPQQQPLRWPSRHHDFWHYCNFKYPGQVGNQPLRRELTPEEKSLLQKGPKIFSYPATIPVKEYISTTTVAAPQAGKLNGVDSSGLYHDVNRILNTYNNKPIHITSPKQNI